MAVNILSIGITGLNAAQANLATTGQNITNASTPGYSRQQVLMQSNQPLYSGSGFFGQGVNVETVKRVYNEHLTGQLLGAQSGVAEMDRYQSQINQITNLVADTTVGLSPALAGFFTSLDQLAANPASVPARQAFLSESQSLAARFQNLNMRLDEVRAGVNSQIANEVSLINTYGEQIAQINDRILTAEASGRGQPANDLRDQRDQLILDLNKEIRTTTIEQSDGSYSIFVGSGQPLVVGSNISRLSVLPDEFDSTRSVVAMTLASGKTTVLPESVITGGALGGLLAFRRESLDTTQNALGRTAIGLAQVFNEQHQLGQDLLGNLGQKFFNVPTPTVFANRNNPVPTDTMDVRITDISKLSGSDYLLTYNGDGNYTLIRQADDRVLVNNTSLPEEIDGLAISLPEGLTNLARGSSFMIEPTRTGARDISLALTDPRNVAIASPVRTSASLSNSGTASISAGQVLDTKAVPPQADIVLRFRESDPPSASGGFIDGFPVGARVRSGSSIIDITSPTTQVPYSFGNNLSFDGTALTLPGGGTLVDGDSFVLKPPPADPIGLKFLESPPLSGNGTLEGFPADTWVSINGAAPVAVTGPTQTLSYNAGDTLNINGEDIELPTTPLVDGRVFSVAAPKLGAIFDQTNVGFNTLYGAPTTSVQGAAMGTSAPSFPLMVIAGSNDRFDLNIDGGGAQTITLAAGGYASSQELAQAVQLGIDAAGGGATVSLEASGKLVVTSNTQGGGSSVVMSAVPANQGLDAAFGVGGATSGARGLSQASVALTDPTVIQAGVNDRFAIDVDGAGSQIILMPAGRYTPEELAKVMQATVNRQAPAPGISVSINNANELVLMSNTLGGGSSVSLSNPASGSGGMTTTGATITETTGLPSAPITLDYDKDSNTLSGFPVGSVVNVAGATGGPFKITAVTDRVPFISSAEITFNGMSVVIDGTPNNKDSFTVEPNISGVTDNRNGLLLGQLQTKGVLDGGKTTFNGSYASMVNQIGNRAREVKVAGQAHQALAEQAENARDSVSGVNLDEEAANLMRYQQHYQAVAKLISVSDKLFDSLLQI